MNTATFLTKVAHQRPDAVAIRHGDDVSTYRELADRARRFAGALRDLGVAKGERLAIASSNRAEYLEAMYGGFMAGLVVVPINARLHPKEMAYIADNCGARVFVHGEEFNEPLATVRSEVPTVAHWISFAPQLSEQSDFSRLIEDADPVDRPVDVEPTDPAWLFYTSGTTGKPKGVIWTHRTIRVVIMNYLSDVYNTQPEDVILHAAPLSHGSGVASLPTIAKGAAHVILDTPSFDSDRVFELIRTWSVTNVAFLAPTQIVKLLADYDPERHDTSSLRGVCYGGAPMYVEDLKRAIRTFGPVFVQIFGQGEAPLTISYLRREDHQIFLEEDNERLGSAGIARTDVELRIVDEEDRELPAGEVGEICCRGDVVMPGYWNNEEATTKALRGGWLHTGDVGTIDERGFLYILDRSKDMIISGGNNIYPREVEEVALTHPDVEEVAVIGVPDEYWGEAVKAIVVIRPGADVSAQDVIEQCADNLASYKKPKSVEFVDELPKNAYGKVMKRELRERYWEGFERRVGGGARAEA